MKKQPPPKASLRTRAEKALAGQKDRLRELSSADLKKLVHELGTHQIELEMQNEELRRAQAELEISHARYADLFDFSPLGYFIFDKNGLIQNVNVTGAGMLGVPKRLLLNKPFLPFIAPGLRATFHDHLADIFKTQTSAKCELTIRKKSGATFDAHLDSLVISRNEGEPPACRTALSDVSEKKKLEQEASKVQKLESIGILAGGIAHDFNNLLSAILGYISLIKTFEFPDEKRIAYLSQAERACQAAADLSYRLLTFSKGGDPVKKELSLPALLPDIVGSLNADPAITTEFSVPSDLPLVDADEGQIKQVFRNLLVNAIEAMPAGGVLRIAGETALLTGDEPLSLKAGTYLKLSIIDHGMGISPDCLSRIFDPYFSTKEKGSDRGMGLGLSICYSIIRKHNGMITVESQPGKGTTAHVYLPIKGGRYAEPRVEAGNRQKDSIRRVLFMDDDQGIREMAIEALTRMGFEVAPAVDGAEAVALYKQALDTGACFDAVILDLTVPGGMGGEPAMKKLLELDPQARGIVSSGYSDDPIINDYRSRGFVKAIAKPYNLRQLSDMLKEL